MDQYSIPNAYFINGVDVCKEFALAFGKGCGGRVFSDVLVLRKGDIALFGNPAAWSFLQQAITEGRNWYYGDKAYFGRGRYYRITKNAYQSDCATIGSMDRLKQLGITIRPRQYGRKILICRQSAAFYELHGINRDEWVRNTIQTIKQYTNRPIEIRDKGVGSMTEMLFARALQDVHAVVVYTSVAGVQAAINGVPCFATEKCASLAFGSNDLSMIDNPKLPDNREELAASLANSQWTINEIRNGLAWRMLNESVE
jgi:hypothetical protein